MKRKTHGKTNEKWSSERQRNLGNGSETKREIKENAKKVIDREKNEIPEK